MKNDYPWSLFGMAHFLTDLAPWELPTLKSEEEEEERRSAAAAVSVTEKILFILEHRCLVFLGGPVYLIPGRIIH